MVSFESELRYLRDAFQPGMPIRAEGLQRATKLIERLHLRLRKLEAAQAQGQADQNNPQNPDEPLAKDKRAVDPPSA